MFYSHCHLSVERAKLEWNLRSKHIFIKQTFNHWTGVTDWDVVHSLYWVCMYGGVKEWFLELCGTAWNDACGWLWEGWRGLQKRHWANCGPFSTPRVYSRVPGLMCTRKISSVPPTQPTTLVGYCQNAPSWRGRWGQPQPPTRLPDQTGVKLLVSYRRSLAHLKHCPCHFNPVEIKRECG